MDNLWIQNSLFMNIIMFIFRPEIYKSSLFYRIISSLGVLISKTIRGSWLRALLSHESWEQEAIKGSRLIKVAPKINNPLKKLRYFLNTIIQNSFPFKIVLNAVDAFIQTPISTVAYILLPFILTNTILKAFFENFTPKSLLYRAILLILLFFLLNVRASLKSLLISSGVWKFFTWFFDVNLLPQDSSKVLHYRDRLGFAAIGVIAGLLYYILPQSTFIKLFGVIFVSTAIYIWPGLGLAFTAFMLPLLPTTYTIGIIGLTFLSVILNYTDINKTLPAAFFPALLFMAVAGMAAVFSVMKSESLKTLPLYLAYFMMFYSAAVLFRDSKTIKMVLAFIIVSTLILSLLGIYQYFFVRIPTAQAWVDVKQFPELSTRVYATLENPNVLGEYLVLSIPLLAGFFWATGKLRHKSFLAVVLCMLTLCLILTFSRGAWLGLAVSVFIFALIKEPRLLVLFIILAVLSPMFLPSVVTNRIASIGSLEDSSNAYRITIWIAALRMIKDYWLTGVGLGLAAFSRVYRDYMIAGASAVHAHNLYLEICLELGVIGIFSLLWMVLRGFSEALTSVKGNDKISYITVGIVAALAGHLFHGLFDYVWYSPRIVIAF
ncbi:MAG: O-antigen polymerase, partial [Thermoanaerobacteraceae bacterium]|nr:O-antigen polymerase [Thermoanaerobacteraceae bacterium]